MVAAPQSTEPWTESTCLSALAGVKRPGDRSFYRSQLQWLQRVQRPDGGWPPNPTVDESTWVTALALLLPADDLGRERYARGVSWLLEQVGEESTLSWRIGQFLSGQGWTEAGQSAGWPWYPGAAAWVFPTAISILALRKAPGTKHTRDRIQAGRRFLLSHMCADGGWNHGGTLALGVEAESYPETTGAALLALEGVDDARLERSIETARLHLRNCRSREAAAWLRLGLSAHGILTPAFTSGKRAPDDREAALEAIADAAATGENVLL